MLMQIRRCIDFRIGHLFADAACVAQGHKQCIGAEFMFLMISLWLLLLGMFSHKFHSYQRHCWQDGRAGLPESKIPAGYPEIMKEKTIL